MHSLTAEWYDACAQLVIFSESSAAPREKKDAFQRVLVRLFSLVHCSALKQVTVCEDDSFEVIEMSSMDAITLDCLRRLETDPNVNEKRTEIVLQWIQHLVIQIHLERLEHLEYLHQLNLEVPEYLMYLVRLEYLLGHEE